MPNTSTEIQTLAPNAHLPTSSEWSTITSMASELITTGFLPTTIQKPAQAAAIMLKGRELGIPPMYALSNINVIKGKPVANAELMMALVKRAYGPGSIWFEESTNDIATVGYRLPGHTKDRFHSFTIQDATRAQLGGDNWKKYPAAMLRARAVSATCRMAYPEVIAGMYSPGELGDPVTIDDEGEVQSVGSYDPQTDTGVPPHAAASRGYSVTVENIDTDTGEVSGPADDEQDRVEALKDLLGAANAHGISEDDVELYFEYAGIDAETVTVERMNKIEKGIRTNTKAFEDAVEKAKAMRELNPSADELGA